MDSKVSTEAAVTVVCGLPLLYLLLAYLGYRRHTKGEKWP